MGEIVNVIVTKQPTGVFGLTFDVEEFPPTDKVSSIYVISKVSPSIISDKIILPRDRLISINGKKEELDSYCKTAEAKSLPEWSVVLFRVKAPPRQQVSRPRDPPAFITTDRRPDDYRFNSDVSVLYTTPPEELERVRWGNSISQHSQSTSMSASASMSELKQHQPSSQSHDYQTNNWIDKHHATPPLNSMNGGNFDDRSNSSLSGFSSYQLSDFQDVNQYNTPDSQSGNLPHHNSLQFSNNQRMPYNSLPSHQHNISQLNGNQQYAPQQRGYQNNYALYQGYNSQPIPQNRGNQSGGVAYHPGYNSVPLERHRPVGASHNESETDGTESLTCSTMSVSQYSTESSRSKYYHEELAKVALKKPGTVDWSSQFRITYDDPNGIQVRKVSFKKKILNDNKEVRWIMFDNIPHEHHAGFGPQGPLRSGDVLVAINDALAPFDGVTSWFRKIVGDASRDGQQLNFIIQRPVSSGDADNQSLKDFQSIVTDLPPQMRQRRLTATSTTSAQSESERGKNLTINPELQEKGRGLFEGVRKSLQALPIEKLGRFRLVFHEISSAYGSICAELQRQLIPRTSIIVPAEARRGLTSVEEYHTHLTLYETGGGQFQSPEGCVDGRENCDHEMQELVERMYQKIASRRGDADLLLSLNPQVRSGPISIQDLQRLSINQESQSNKPSPQMHLEVLSLPILDSQTKTWHSPVLYCKHSINIIVLDTGAFAKGSDINSLQFQLSSLLSEISCYSRDFINDRNSESHQIMGKVLLVLTDSRNSFATKDLNLLKSSIHELLPNHRTMLIKSNNYPFIFYRDSADVEDIRQVLFRELRQLSEKDIQGSNKYPRAAIMAAQELHKLSHSEIIDRNEIEKHLEVLESDITSEDDEARNSLIEGTLSYLHNTGQAYIPAYSLSELIGKSEPGFKHSVLLHPFRLVSYYDRLMNQHDDTENLRSKGEISITELKRILHGLSPSTDSGKLIDLFKELQIILPTCKEGNKMLSMPMLLKAELPLGKCDEFGSAPQLVLSYPDNQCFLLITCLLHQFAKEAHSRNRTSRLSFGSSQGTYDLFGFTIKISLATWTWWDQLQIYGDGQVSRELSRHVCESQKHICIYAQNSENSTTTNELTAQLVSIMDAFHKRMQHKPVFGNPCPIQDKCTHRPYHVLSFDRQSSCSGHNLSHMPDLMSFNPARLGTVHEQVRLSKKEEIMSRQAFNLPSEILDIFDEYSTLERNWVGLAKKEQMSQAQIEKIGSCEAKSFTLLKELSMSGGYTIQHLLGQLAKFEHVELTVMIGKWIDEQMRKP